MNSRLSPTRAPLFLSIPLCSMLSSGKGDEVPLRLYSWPNGSCAFSSLLRACTGEVQADDSTSSTQSAQGLHRCHPC